jgi:hypothetical protein
METLRGFGGSAPATLWSGATAGDSPTLPSKELSWYRRSRLAGAHPPAPTTLMMGRWFKASTANYLGACLPVGRALPGSERWPAAPGDRRGARCAISAPKPETTLFGRDWLRRLSGPISLYCPNSISPIYCGAKASLVPK